MSPQNTQSFKSGARIISRGEDAQKTFLILKGKVRVFLERDKKVVTLAELSSGAIFGETALFGGKTYGAHVEALDDTELAVITPENFAGKVENCDPMLRAIIEMLIERLRKTNEALLRSETRKFMDIAFV